MGQALPLGLMVLLFSLQSLFTRLYSRSYAGRDAARATSVFSVCYGVFIAFCSLAFNGFVFRPSLWTALFGVLNALVLILYNTSMIRGGNLGSYAFLMLSSLFGGIAIPLFVALIFLGESLTLLKCLAIALMIIAVILMNSKGLTLKNAPLKYYIWCALLFAANGAYGSVMSLQVNRLGGRESAEMLVILFACSALFAALGEILKGRGKDLLGGFDMGGRALVWLAACCVSAFAAARLMLYLLGKMDSGILHTVNNGGVLVLSFLYSMTLFKERPELTQLLGMGIAVASIVMLSV